MSILNIKDENGNWISVPAIKGDKGDSVERIELTYDDSTNTIKRGVVTQTYASLLPLVNDKSKIVVINYYGNVYYVSWIVSSSIAWSNSFVSESYAWDDRIIINDDNEVKFSQIKNPNVVQTLGDSTEDVISQKGVTDEFDKLSDDLDRLKRIVYGTVIEEADYTFANADVEAIPDKVNGHKVFDGAEMAVTEIEGNTVNAQLTRECHVYGNTVKDGDTLKSVELNEVTYCGENLVDAQNEPLVNWFLDTYGKVHPSSSSNLEKSIIVKVKPNTAYYFFNKSTGGGQRLRVGTFDHVPSIGDTAINRFELTIDSAINVGGSLTTPSNALYAFIFFWNLPSSDSSTIRNYLSNMMMSQGSAKPEFKPYIAQTIPFSPSVTLNGLTTKDEIYSAVEGNEIVTRKIQRYGSVDLGSSTWTYVGNCVFRTSNISNFTAGGNLLSGVYHKSTATSTSAVEDKGAYLGSTSLNIRDDRFTDADAFKTAANGIMLVYELATPTITEISRTPLTMDFEAVENISVSNENEGIADATTSISKGILKSSGYKAITYHGAEDKTLFDILNAVTLRSAGSAHDRILARENEDGTFDLVMETKVGTIDLGTLNWTFDPVFSRWLWALNGARLPVNNSTKAEMICSTYNVNSIDAIFPSVSARNIGIGLATNGRVYVQNDSDTIKPTGILNYELAAPTTTTLVSGLSEEDIAVITEANATIEVIGNPDKAHAKPNIKTIIQVEKAIEG